MELEKPETILKELIHVLSPSWSLTKEGRAYINRMDSALRNLRENYIEKPESSERFSVTLDKRITSLEQRVYFLESMKTFTYPIQQPQQPMTPPTPWQQPPTIWGPTCLGGINQKEHNQTHEGQG